MKRVVAAAVPLTVLALLVYAVGWHTWGFLYGLGVHPYPAGSATPWTYQMWSGIVPALTVLTLFGSLGGMYHIHNCHMDGCWRIGKHRVAGTPWCDRHLGNAVPAVSIEELLAKVLAELRDWRADDLRTHTGDL